MNLQLESTAHLDRHYQIMFLERHNLEEVYSVGPEGKMLKIEEIRKGLAKYGRWSGRKDIVLINEWKDTGWNKPGDQWTLQPAYTNKGMQRQVIWKMLNKAQKAEAIRLRNACVWAEVFYALPQATLLSEWF